MYKSKQDFYRIGRVRISITNNKEVIEMIKDIVSAQIKGYVCISNMRTVVIANSDDSYQKVMENSLFNTPDGTPLVWCGKLWGLKKVQRACGPHIFEEMLKDQSQQLESVYNNFKKVLQEKFTVEDLQKEFTNLRKLNDILQEMKSLSENSVKQEVLRADLKNIQTEVSKIPSRRPSGTSGSTNPKKKGWWPPFKKKKR